MGDGMRDELETRVDKRAERIRMMYETTGPNRNKMKEIATTGARYFLSQEAELALLRPVVNALEKQVLQSGSLLGLSEAVTKAMAAWRQSHPQDPEVPGG